MKKQNMSEIVISSDKHKLDLKFINEFISNSYWGKGRTIIETEKCVENSLNFGIYSNGKQIGYARVVTDYTVFAYLMDLFIIVTERGKGYSVRLMDEIVNHPKLKKISSWKLASVDAQGLYRKYGFKNLEKPEILMEMKKSNTVANNG